MWETYRPTGRNNGERRMPPGLDPEQFKIRTEADRERARRFIQKAKDDFKARPPSAKSGRYLYWPILKELNRRQPIHGTILREWLMQKIGRESDGQNTGRAGTSMIRHGLITKNDRIGWKLTEPGRRILKEFL